VFDILEGTSQRPVVLGVLGESLLVGTNQGLFASDGTVGDSRSLGAMRVWSGFYGDWSEVVDDVLYFPAGGPVPSRGAPTGRRKEPTSSLTSYPMARSSTAAPIRAPSSI